MRSGTLVIVGVGLLGGSLALAARRRGVAARLVGVDTEPHTLRFALESGMLDEVHTDLSVAAGPADLIVFCTPVDRIAEQVIEASAHVRPGTLLTDVGSTKAAIVRGVSGRLPPGVEFVGSHPLAGSEKNGPAHASAHLLDDRLVVVTPSAETSDNALSQIRAFWTALGARVLAMDAEEHDRVLALTSHLPHLLSSALAGILPSDSNEFTAGGFRDVTRLAAGHPNLWSAIFRANAENLMDALDQFEDRLQRFRQALLQNDSAALEALLRQGKEVRDGLS